VDRLEGLQDFPVLKEMTEQDILLYAKTACSRSRKCLIWVGFDGVELHGANGYLKSSFA
jgi:N-ethylmaleimide reductase